MSRLFLVRHGRAAAGWSDHVDPGLDDVGRQQAEVVARRLAGLGTRSIVTSPFARCRQTAAPLAAVWAVEPGVEPGVAELPSPDGVAMGERAAWLRQVVGGAWDDLGERYVSYRDLVVRTLHSLPGDTVVFSHFVAINVAIGEALGDRRMVVRSLDNCSVTVVDIADGALRLVEAGHEADTLIR